VLCRVNSITLIIYACRLESSNKNREDKFRIRIAVKKNAQYSCLFHLDSSAMAPRSFSFAGRFIGQRCIVLVFGLYEIGVGLLPFRRIAFASGHKFCHGVVGGHILLIGL